MSNLFKRVDSVSRFTAVNRDTESTRLLPALNARSANRRIIAGTLTRELVAVRMSTRWRIEYRQIHYPPKRFAVQDHR